MVEITLSRTHQAIDTMLAASAGSPRRSHGVPFRKMGSPCDRQVWMHLRWIDAVEPMSASAVRKVRRSKIERNRVLGELEDIGCEIIAVDFAEQLASGWLSSHVCAEVIGLPDAPRTPHIVHVEAVEQKYFTPIRKKGVLAARPEHWTEMQLAMAALGTERALYVLVNRNTEERYFERVRAEHGAAASEVSRAMRTVAQGQMPPTASDDAKSPPCVFCAFKPFCHEGRPVEESNCRTCLFVSLLPNGDVQCRRYGTDLDPEAQAAGCPAHLFHPDMIHGDQTDAGPDPEAPDWIEYLLRDGSYWTDGAKSS